MTPQQTLQQAQSQCPANPKHPPHLCIPNQGSGGHSSLHQHTVEHGMAGDTHSSHSTDRLRDGHMSAGIDPNAVHRRLRI